MAIKFKKRRYVVLANKANKIEALRVLNTPEARKVHKEMSTHMYGRTKVNVAGFYEKSGKHPIRCK